ncbi:MAG: alpha-2-macroglobulin family protein [Planctomycetota bacterium]
MSTPLLGLLLLAVLPQDPPQRDVRDLILTGEPEAAMRATLQVEDPALRAKVQAALLHGLARAQSMLEVVRIWPRSPVADDALLAAASVLNLVANRSGAMHVGEALDLLDDAQDERVDGARRGELILDLWSSLRLRRLEGGDPDTLDEAERLLRAASVTRFGFEPRHIAPDADRSLGDLVREPILLGATRVPPGPLDWSRLRVGGEPDVTSVLTPADPAAAFPKLPCGAWLVELRSTAGPFRALRRVEVTDIDVVTLHDHQHLALLALRKGEAFDGRVRLLADGSVPLSADFVRTAYLSFDCSPWSLAELAVDDGTLNVSSMRIASAYAYTTPTPPFVAHVMVDRPMHRPGETVHGRLILRRCRIEDEGLDIRVRTEAAADTALWFTAFEGTDHPIRRRITTDARGMVDFEVEIDEQEKPSDLRFAFATIDESTPWSISLQPTRIAAFRAPVLSVAIEAPRQITPGDPTPCVLRAKLRWASGGPASGLQVHAHVMGRTDSSGFDQDHDLISDESGCAAIPVDPAHLALGSTIECSVKVASPDGRTEEASCEVLVGSAELSRTAPARFCGGLVLGFLDPVRAEHNAKLSIRGGTNETVLLVVGRGRDAKVSAVELDEHGEATTSIWVDRRFWPMLDVCVADASGSARLREPIVFDTAISPSIEVPPGCKPGESIELRASGLRSGTLVTFDVIDERIYRLQSDRTADPDFAMRPEVTPAQWRWSRSESPISPRELLAPLLQDGRISWPPPYGAGDVDARGTPGPGGPSTPGLGGETQTRKDFRATAAFVTVVAGDDGIATLPVKMPDDLTTWRVTVIGIDPDGSAFREQRALTTSLPLSAEPLLPRIARVGDRFEGMVLVDHREGPDQVAVAVSSGDDKLAVEDGASRVDAAAGTTGIAHLRITAKAPGDAVLDLQATDGTHADHSQRHLPVEDDLIERRRLFVAQGRELLELRLAEDLPAAAVMDIELFCGSAAIWNSFATALAVYPHGCVEQTLSRVLPYFARARSAKRRGEPAPVQDPGFKERLAAGISRLRALYRGRSEGFAWWPSEDADTGMTALAIHALCVMREAGIDPRSLGLDFELGSGRFRDAIDSVMHDAAPDNASIDLAAAALRFDPAHAPARAAIDALVDRMPCLPAGLLARCGLALLGAGDEARARRCLEAARRADASTSSFPGEAPIAAHALCTELALALHESAHDDVGRLIIEMLEGRPSTYATSCALTALADLAEQQPQDGFEVQVDLGGEVRKVVLDAAHGFTARLRDLPARDCTLRSSASPLLIARASAVVRRERASDHASWSSPLQVSREFGSYVECRARRVWEPDSAALHAGGSCLLRVTVDTAQQVDYVIVEIPLPAGFEYVDEQPDLDRFDDRVAFAIRSLRPGHRIERLVRLVPTLTGRVMWPPVTAQSMYDPELEGGTAGAWLEVLPPAPPKVAVTTTSVPMLVVEPLPEEWHPPEPDLHELMIRTIEDIARGQQHVAPDDEDRERVHDALEGLLAWADADPDAARADLSCLLRDLDRWGGEISTEEWREVRTRLRLALDRCLLRLLDRLEHDQLDDPDRDQLDEACELLDGDISGERRDALLLRLLRCADREHEDALMRVLDRAPSHVESDAVHAMLLHLLHTRSPRIGDLVVPLLRDEDLQHVPTSRVLALIDALDSSAVERLLRVLWQDRLSRIVLQGELAKSEFVSEHADELVEVLPAEAWRALPLEQSLIALEQASVDDPLEFLARQLRPIGDFQRALATSQDAAHNGLLARYLIRAGIDSLGESGDPGDRIRAHWDAVLRAVVGHDATRAAGLLADALMRDADLVDVIDLDELVGPLWRVVVDGFATLDAPTRERLFVTCGAAAMESLWSYASDAQDLPLVEAILRSVPGGPEFLAENRDDDTPEDLAELPPFERAARVILRDGVKAALAGPLAREAAWLLRLRGL